MDRVEIQRNAAHASKECDPNSIKAKRPKYVSRNYPTKARAPVFQIRAQKYKGSQLGEEPSQ